MSSRTIAFAVAPSGQHHPKQFNLPAATGAGLGLSAFVCALAWSFNSTPFAPEMARDFASVTFAAAPQDVRYKTAMASRVQIANAGDDIVVTGNIDRAAVGKIFTERFNATATRSVASSDPAPDTLAPSDIKLASAAPMISPRRAIAKPQNTEPSTKEIAQAAKVAALGPAVATKTTLAEKLWGKEKPPTLLAFASPDGGVMNDGSPIVTDRRASLLPPFDRKTAVYDIAARKVYLPDGTTLEAHSGLGGKMDDARFAHVRMQGVTPPHVYDLTPREALFHGVEALRMKPIHGEDAIFGRNGLLTHTYMLGASGQSNGCVSFKDYATFLRAYKNGDITRLAVLARVD